MVFYVTIEKDQISVTYEGGLLLHLPFIIVQIELWLLNHQYHLAVFYLLTVNYLILLLFLNLDQWTEQIFLFADVPFDTNTARKLLCVEWHIPFELCVKKIDCRMYKFAYNCFASDI